MSTRPLRYTADDLVSRIDWERATPVTLLVDGVRADDLDASDELVQAWRAMERAYLQHVAPLAERVDLVLYPGSAALAAVTSRGDGA